MFLVGLSVLVVFFLALVAEPETWPDKIAAFLREHHLHHG